MQQTSQEKFKIGKVLKRNGNKSYVKWKRYNNRFNSWIDKKDLERNFINESFKYNLLNESFKINCLNVIL